jgi:hypothetical protein
MSYKATLSQWWPLNTGLTVIIENDVKHPLPKEDH